MSIKVKDTISGNISSSNKSTNDGANQNISDTYIKGLSVSGRTITYTKGDGGTGTITTQDTNTTYSQATSSTLGLVKIGFPESGKNYPVELNNSGQMFVNVPWTDNNTTYGLVGAQNTTGLVKNGSSVTSASGYIACPIIGGIPYYKDTNTTYSLGSFGITATAAELNYCDGVTSNIQTQLNGKAASSHSHSWSNITSGVPATATRWPSWGEVTGKPSTFAPSSHSHDSITATVPSSGVKDLISASIANNDCFRLRAGGTDNAGYIEFATADDGTEPIYFRQYTGTFSTITRTATILDASGNTSFPGIVSASQFNGNIDWSKITNKPSTCTPSPHNHSWSNITSGVPATATRWPSWSEVTSKPSTFTPSSHSHSYLPLSGGNMTGNINYTAKGNSYIGNGANDAANGVGGALNNLVISSWNGISFTTGCGGQTYTGKTAVGINCRTGALYAASLNGTLNGNVNGRLSREMNANTVSTLTSIPTSKALVIANLSKATTISVASGMAVGDSITVICNPSAAFTQPIPTTGAYKSMDGDSLKVTAGKPFEINIICYASGAYSISCKVSK